MPSLTEQDLIHLAACDVRLQTLIIKVAKRTPLMVEWAGSKAIRIRPLPLDWKNTRHFYELAAHVWAESLKAHIPVQWGGVFDDYGYYELI